MSLAKLAKDHNNKVVLEGGIKELVSCGPPILLCVEERYFAEKYGNKYKESILEAIEKVGKKLRADAYEKGNNCAPTMYGSHWHFNLTGSMPYEVHAVQYYKIKNSEIENNGKM